MGSGLSLRSPRNDKGGALYVTRAAPILLLALLASCSHYPAGVRGVPATSPWITLPLARWVGENRAVPEAVAACRPPECRPALAVGVVRLSGLDAQAAQAVLADPGQLARALETPREGKPQQTAVSLKPLREGAASGFGLVLSRADGERRAAYGAALGQRSGEDLRVVLVIGEEPDTVEDTARRVAREHLGS